ncbi:hypothetical protein WN944_023019 [Citrus x changshan-huyou]|uniref:Uncharacterized protein n=1 Tax=Citrus x changshan-huyou TaxID=2935761 RepID=A0AAP0QWL0_9ROSI
MKSESMAYRRRQQEKGLFSTTRKTLEDDEEDDDSSSNSNSSSSRLAAKAIRASSAHRDSSLSSAYNRTTTSSSPSSPSPLQDSKPCEYTSMKSLNESKHGFWSNLARKAKAVILDEDDGGDGDVPQQQQLPQNATHHNHMPRTDSRPKFRDQYQSNDTHQKSEGPALQKGFDAITSSISYIGNAVEGGLTIVENRTSGIIQETRKHIRKKPGISATQNQGIKQPHVQAQVQPSVQNDQELQLKASRDVAMAMAAKAKLLLRELKTVKADLAFAKERCAQLEEENKILRESRQRGDNPEDDDLIRLQLETLLAEKARLAHENSVYARENRFLREVVEYHQLTMQDVVYLNEGTEEVTEVYPIKVVSNPESVPGPPFSTSSLPHHTSVQVTHDGLPRPSPPPEVAQTASAPSSVSPLSSQRM